MPCQICKAPMPNAGACPQCGYVPAKTPPPAAKSKRRPFLRFQIFAHLLWLVFPLYFYGRLLTSDAYRISLEIAKSSPDLKGILGQGIHTQWLPAGSALSWYNSDFAEWSVGLSGSAGSGRLYGVANNVAGLWEFSRLTFVAAKGGAEIDLAPTPSRLRLPATSVKKVYL